MPGCHEHPRLFASWQGVDQVLKLLCESLRRRLSQSLKAWTLTLSFFGMSLASSYLQALGGIFNRKPVPFSPGLEGVPGPCHQQTW